MKLTNMDESRINGAIMEESREETASQINVLRQKSKEFSSDKSFKS